MKRRMDAGFILAIGMPGSGLLVNQMLAVASLAKMSEYPDNRRAVVWIVALLLSDIVAAQLVFVQLVVEGLARDAQNLCRRTDAAQGLLQGLGDDALLE